MAFNPPIVYYQVGEGLVSLSITEWTNTYGAVCGPFYYTLNTPAQYSTSITIGSTTNSSFLDINTVNPLDHMISPTSAISNTITMTGTLYKTYSSDAFMSSSEILIIRIVSTSISYITPPTTSPPNLFFTVTDLATVQASPSFQLTDTDALALLFSLVLLPSRTPADSTVMTI